MWLKVKKWLPRLALVLAVVVIAWSLGRSLWMYLEYNWKTVTFPYPVDYGEGPVLDQVMRMARFQNIYLPIQHRSLIPSQIILPFTTSFRHLSPGSTVQLTGMGVEFPP